MLAKDDKGYTLLDYLYKNWSPKKIIFLIELLPSKEDQQTALTTKNDDNNVDIRRIACVKEKFADLFPEEKNTGRLQKRKTRMNLFDVEEALGKRYETLLTQKVKYSYSKNKNTFLNLLNSSSRKKDEDNNEVTLRK